VGTGTFTALLSEIHPFLHGLPGNVLKTPVIAVLQERFQLMPDIIPVNG